ncbi:MAG TPA: hypothetical protein VFJ85_09505 [Acidimicrobiales bacterium]|nr:hypothetical protein [Acidimicrobiales bacterium]
MTNHPSARRAAGAGALLAAAALLLAACGGDKYHTSSGATPTTGAAASTLATGTTSRGPVVVDAGGRTLYRFDKDTAGSGTSACTGDCATAWPPALVTGTPTATGVAGTLGTVTRADGATQVTLDGHPLYRFGGDQKPGDTAGDGLGGVWHVVAAGAAPAATSQPSGSRY